MGTKTITLDPLTDINLNAREKIKYVNGGNQDSVAHGTIKNEHKSFNNNQIVTEDKSVIRTKKTLTYIKEGDFGIVWKNALVFGSGHLAYLYAIFVSLAMFSWRVQLWSKYNFFPK